MRFLKLRSVTAALAAGLFLAIPGMPAFAQNTDAKPADQQKQDAAKAGQKKIDEIAEAGRVVTGPAGNPECVWVGKRVIFRLWNDDLDAAFRHLDIYDRFGCPGGHVQATFRCVVKQGDLDPKAADALNNRVQACWLNPGLPPSPAAAQATPPAEGTTTR